MVSCGTYLRKYGHPDINLFKDSAFSEFKSTVDAEMKRLQSKGVGSKKQQAKPLNKSEEERLWETQQFPGEHNIWSVFCFIIVIMNIDLFVKIHPK